MNKFLLGRNAENNKKDNRMQDVPFIEHPQVTTAIEKMNTTIQAQATCIVQGLARTGKTALMHYWIDTACTAIYPDQILMVNLLSAGKKTDKNPFLPAQTLDLMQRMDTMLHRLQNPPDRRSTHRRDSIQAPKQRPPHAPTLLNRIWSAIDDLQIRAIVIDNAQLLHVGTLQWLHDLREMIEFPISLVFVAQLADGERYPMSLYSGLNQIPTIQNDILETAMLDRMNREYYFEHIFEPLFTHLKVKLPELSDKPSKQEQQDFINHTRALADQTWRFFNGDWTLIKRLATVIQRSMTIHPNESYALTSAMIDEITIMMNQGVVIPAKDVSEQ